MRDDTLLLDAGTPFIKGGEARTSFFIPVEGPLGSVMCLDERWRVTVTSEDRPLFPRFHPTFDPSHDM